MQIPSVEVYSEIGSLKKVLIHKPGKELENLMPEYIDRLLFDDIPYLKIIREEHDIFKETLEQNGVETVYLTDIIEESLTDEAVKDEFIKEYIYESGIYNKKQFEILKGYFKSMSTREMLDKMIEGIRKTDISCKTQKNLIDYLDNCYPFIIDPIPNLYFTRDPFSCIGSGVSINSMCTATRRRETLFAKYIFKYNESYFQTPIWYDRTDEPSIEGGDILVLSDEVVAVGISQRTTPKAIELFSENILKAQVGFKKVIAIDIPKTRSFMHLDTVFTMIDKDKFTIHPNIKDSLKILVIELQDDKISIQEENKNLGDILKKYLNLDDVTLIKCGGNSIVDASREQWNDGSNTFAISPGKVIAYNRNYVTNKIMQDNGIEVITIPSSELSRGRGGPRCMTMPLVRQKL